MKKVLVIGLVFALTFILGYATPLLAQGQTKLSGPHYTLNIIGVKGKSPTMTSSDRHTIFVGLGSKTDKVTTNIYLQPGYNFNVCDGNGFDAAYDCSGTQIKSYTGATFQLPCNTGLTYDPNYGCPADIAQRSYNVWARALGKPGFEARMKTCATDVTTNEVFCPTTQLVLKRSTGKSLWQDATSELTSLVADIDNDGYLETIALFADGFQDFFWQYDNNGLRHAQIRFYPVMQ